MFEHKAGSYENDNELSGSVKESYGFFTNFINDFKYIILKIHKIRRYRSMAFVTYVGFMTNTYKNGSQIFLNLPASFYSKLFHIFLLA